MNINKLTFYKHRRNLYVGPRLLTLDSDEDPVDLDEDYEEDDDVGQDEDYAPVKPPAPSRPPAPAKRRREKRLILEESRYLGEGFIQ